MLSDLMGYIQFRLGAEVDASGQVLSDTSWSEQLHSSDLWMVLEGAHVLTLMLFAGTILMVDLRLLGVAFRKTPVSQVTDTLLPYTLAGFAVMVATGLLLFFSNPFEYYHNFWFRLKFVFLAFAAVNILYFHWRVQANRPAWDEQAKPPASARTCAALSLVLWTAIIIGGRFVAYDWFECARAAPLVAELAECSARTITLARFGVESL